jgi:uncharacterized protein (TIGR02145 family)
MARKRIFSVIIMALLLSLMINSCKKDDNGNPYNGRTTAIFNPALTYGTMTDLEGNEYKTITIGTQTWMVENLRTAKYRDGTEIPNVTDNMEWVYLTTGAYCNYQNTKRADSIATYGMLYNWYAVNDAHNIAPTGWHVATDAEWTTLTTYLGGESVTGGKLKEIGTTHWASPNAGATNQTGFTALPSGFRLIDGSFSNMDYYGYWWSATEYNTYRAWRHNAYTNFGYFYRDYSQKENGYSVRCVRD